MLNNIEFNSTYNNKEAKEVKLKRKDFDGQLIIENYSELERLELQEIDSINKVTLKNLPKLQECTIWDCGLREIVIENCLQIKRLNVRNNHLTNLEFLKDLDNLEELEIDNNEEIDPEPECLPKNLKSFACENTKFKPFQELIELVEQDPQKLAKKFWSLQKKYNTLKKNLASLTEVRSQELSSLKTEELINEAKERAKEREKKIEELSKLVLKTKEQTSEIQSFICEKTINFLRTKSIFLNARRGTIEELKERYNELEKFLKNKNAKFAIMGDAISNIGGTAGSTTPLGVIPKSLGEFIKVGNEYSKIKFLVKSSEEFQILLKNEDELSELDSVYDSLINLSGINVLNLKDKQVYRKKHLFDTDCETSAILESKGIWEGKLLNSETMETAIMLLSGNLKELEEEWDRQFSEFKNKLKLGKEYTEIFFQEMEIRIKIQKSKSQLDKLFNSAKSRLESKKWWDISEEKEKRTKDRQLLLENFLKDQALLTIFDKELLEKKLTKEGLNTILQRQKEFIDLQAKLEGLKNQQIQISPK